MSPQLQEIEEQALRLPKGDREVLVASLLQSFESGGEEVDGAWLDEAERRYQEWRAGRSQAEPGGEQFFATARRDLGWE